MGATLSSGFQPPEMAAAQHSAQDVIGDLGGMPVRIPKEMAEYVEYDGDPGWEPRSGPPPIRTYASKIRGFSFRLRLPDMAMLMAPEMWDDWRRNTIYSTPWINVGVGSGEHYPPPGFMNRMRVADGKVDSENWWDDYKEIRQKKFGLTEYKLKVAIPHETGMPGNPKIGRAHV